MRDRTPGVPPLGAEAESYWLRHQPRFRHVLGVIGTLTATDRIERVLDVGMSFQTLLLSRAMPRARIDALGLSEDARFRPVTNFTFWRGDLNEICRDVPPEGPPVKSYDLIVFMEVLEHLSTPPEPVLRYLGSLLKDGGLLIVTTPNAAWLKNRLKMVAGKNPFETLRLDRNNVGHIREYTKGELEAALQAAGLEKVIFERCGLYRFDNLKDNIYSWVADHVHGSLSRTLVAVYRKPRTS